MSNPLFHIERAAAIRAEARGMTISVLENNPPRPVRTGRRCNQAFVLPPDIRGQEGGEHHRHSEKPRGFNTMEPRIGLLNEKRMALNREEKPPFVGRRCSVSAREESQSMFEIRDLNGRMVYPLGAKKRLVSLLAKKSHRSIFSS